MHVCVVPTINTSKHTILFGMHARTHTHTHTPLPLPVWCCFQSKTKPCVGAILCWPEVYALSVLCPSATKEKKNDTGKKFTGCLSLLPVFLLTVWFLVSLNVLVFRFAAHCASESLSSLIFTPHFLPICF